MFSSFNLEVFTISRFPFSTLYGLLYVVGESHLWDNRPPFENQFVAFWGCDTIAPGLQYLQLKLPTVASLKWQPTSFKQMYTWYCKPHCLSIAGEEEVHYCSVPSKSILSICLYAHRSVYLSPLWGSFYLQQVEDTVEAHNLSKSRE